MTSTNQSSHRCNSELGLGKQVSAYAGYSLALKRNAAHCSQSGCLAIVAKGEVYGDVTDRKTIAKFEPMLAVAKKVRN